MSPRSKKQFNKIRHNRKMAIAKAAMELFAENGFDSVSISKIAEAAGVSKGLLYNYYANKEALVKEIVIDGINKMMVDLGTNFSGEMTKARLIDIIDSNIEQLKNNTRYWKIYTSVLTQPKVIELVKKEMFEIIGPFLISVSDYYRKAGVKRPMAQSYLLGSILDGMSLDFFIAPDEYPLNEVRDIIVEKLL